MFPKYELSDTVLMVLYLAMALAIPAIAMYFDDAKMHNR